MTGTSWRRSLFLSRVLVTAALLTMATRGHGGAGIATDGSVGARMTIPGVNGVLTIPQALGRVAGNNLFHSFSQFNIDTGQTADFRTNTASLANVISRVTGGSSSQINGMLQLTPAAGSAPAFFFINPAGVVFGASAAINVPGAFHVSTADYVKFANGDKFHANLGQASTLSSAAPEAFGFLGTTSASVAVKEGATLATQISRPISIVAGDVEINNGGVLTPGGDIRVVALGQAAQEVGLSGTLPAVSGKMTILNGGSLGSVVAAAIDGGSISVSAGSITIDSQGSSKTTGILTRAESGTGNAGSVEISATEALAIVNGGVISASTYAAGHAGTVKVRAGSIVITGQGNTSTTGVFSNAAPGSTGNAGRIGVSATGNLALVDGGEIAASTGSSGNAGTVKVSAGSIVIDGKQSDHYTGILTDSGSTGKAGSIEVSAAGDLAVVNSGQISADTYSVGRAGTVTVSASSAAGNLSLVKGGQISATTYASGDAGTVTVSAGSIAIDRQESSSVTGIFSRAGDGTGNAGRAEVSATGHLSLVNGGTISADTLSAGNAGAVRVSAGSIAINNRDSSGFTGIFSRAEAGTGSAGNVEVSAAGRLAIDQGGAISSDTYTSGNAGTVKVSAGSIAIDRQGSGSFTGIFSRAAGSAGSTGKAGSVEVLASGALSLVNGGVIASDTSSAGDAGTVKVSAGSISIDAQGSDSFTGIFSQATRGTGNAGSVEVFATGNLSLVHGGEITSNTHSSGHAGTVRVSAGSITIDDQGSGSFTGIFSQANSGTGNAGSVEVSATGNLALVHGGEIASNTYTSGHAGTVKVSAGSIAINSQENGSLTGIFSTAQPDSTGNAGSVDVSASGDLSLGNGGQIASNTYSSGHAGTVRVGAGSIAINSGGQISSGTFSSGDAGTVTVSAGRIAIDRQGSGVPTGIFSQANAGTGNAGSIEVAATGDLSLVNGGAIASNTYTSGHAGTLKVSAGRITIDHGGQITSGTFSSGDAGTVTVSADRIAIDGQGSGIPTGIFSQANAGTGNAGSVDVSVTGVLSLDHGGVITSNTYTSGHAGTIKVSADSMVIDHGGAVSSSTLTSGTAGSVTLRAGSLRVDGEASKISAAAAEGSSGQTGFVSVTANDITLANGGQISIENRATVADPSALTPTSITVNAPRVTILNSADAISTRSTGNVAAGSIKITASDTLRLDPSGITTTANQGNGGAIDITAGLLWLQDSQIATSVLGLAGNGGNISIAADSLIMNTGFIQANTAAANASGGLVSITVNNLVASGNSLFLGGNTPYTYQPGVFGFNVIQAAAPTGVSGTVQTSVPRLDVTSSLVGLDTRLINAPVARRLCENTSGSSLVPVGRGGLPPGGADFLSPGQISGIGFVTSPSVSLPTVRANLRTDAFTPCPTAL